MMKIDFNQEMIPKSERLDQALLDAIAHEVNTKIEHLPDGVVAAELINDERMRELNKKYRNKDKTTDVLSFSYVDDENAETLGDVVISPEQARRQAEDGFKNELVTLLVHGILHVFGYDHIKPEDARVMFPIQDAIIDSVTSL